MYDKLWLVPFFPLLGSIINGLLGKRFIKNEKLIGAIGTGMLFLSFLVSCKYFIQLLGDSVKSHQNVIASWMSVGKLQVDWGFLLDPLSALMIMVVTGVGTLIHLYSIGYMHGEEGFYRYFSYLNLFVFSMLMLVLGNNALVMFVGWEGVGLCSYLLIGYYFEKKSAGDAAKKAFVMNRVGDFGFLLGLFTIFWALGSHGVWTINFVEITENAHLLSGDMVLGASVTTVATLCFFLGATGKSAQLPLFTWLPDAMEGPTPVSALIHAATMVTAGVFLVVRCSPIYEYSPLILNVVTIVGMTTAFFAATVALVQTDIKKIIAYSTCSQLGYMFFAAGVGAYNVAMFHLFTHAFFKALLFLGSGSVIHAFKDEQNINQMGAVWKKLPYTYIFMIIGTLALTGFPFLSGFYSKDAIIEFAYLKGNTTGYYAAGVGILTAVLTSIYSWRLIFKTFHGDYNNKKININEMHESPLVMLLPLFILAIGAIFVGFLFKDLFIGNSSGNIFWGDSIKFLNPLSTEHPPLWFLLTTPALVLTSIPIAYYLFVKDKDIPNRIAQSNKPLHNFLINKWYFDELYDVLFIKFSKKLGIFFWKVVDVKIIDKFGPDGVSSLINRLSLKASKFQSGFIYQYAFMILLGFSALLTFLILN